MTSVSPVRTPQLLPKRHTLCQPVIVPVLEDWFRPRETRQVRLQILRGVWTGRNHGYFDQTKSGVGACHFLKCVNGERKNRAVYTKIGVTIVQLSDASERPTSSPYEEGA